MPHNQAALVAVSVKPKSLDHDAAEAIGASCKALVAVMGLHDQHKGFSPQGAY
jgi:hypothetical protein